MRGTRFGFQHIGCCSAGGLLLLCALGQTSVGRVVGRASLLFVVERRLLFVFFVGLPALVGAVLGLPGVELPFVVDDVRLPLVFGLRPVVVQSVCCWRFPFVCPVVG